MSHHSPQLPQITINDTLLNTFRHNIIMEKTWISGLWTWAKEKLPSPQGDPGQEEALICQNNLILDFDASESESDRQELRTLVKDFSRYGEKLARDFDKLVKMRPQKLHNEAEKAVRNSIRTAVLMLGGACNMNCQMCITDRRKSKDEISWEAASEVLDQMRGMGARMILTPGLGEPTLDRRFWKVAEYARDHGMEWIVVTNGLKIDAEMARRLSEYPVSIALKFWSTDPEVFYKMARPRMGLDRFREHFARMPSRGKDILVPRSLAFLMEHLPKERICASVTAWNENFRDVVENIIPFTEQHGIEMHLDSISQGGRYENKHGWDLTPEQDRELSSYYARRNVARRLLNFPVDHEGAMCSIIEMPPRELKAARIKREDLRVVSRDGVMSLPDMRFRHPKHRKALRAIRWTPVRGPHKA